MGLSRTWREPKRKEHDLLDAEGNKNSGETEAEDTTRN